MVLSVTKLVAMLALILASLPLLGAAGGDLAVTWKDCSDASYHTKITTLTPSSCHIGTQCAITGSGNLDEDINDLTFTMSTAFSAGLPLVDCQGDASVSQKCNFPMGAGSLTMDGVTFPYKAGPQQISVDLQISKLLPAATVKTTTQITSVASNGDKIFCIKVITGKSDENGDVSLSYQDCGDSQTHTKITGLQPTSVTPGKLTKITGAGTLDKDIADGTFHLQTFYSGGDLLDCTGDGSVTRKCLLGGVLGSLTFEQLAFPVKKGVAPVTVDLNLSPLVPASLAVTSTRVTGVTKSGDNIFCLDVFTKNADGPQPPADTYSCVQDVCTSDPTGVPLATCQAACGGTGSVVV